MKIKKIKKKLILFIPLIIIMIISLLTMYNARYMNLSYSSYLLKQSIWYVLFFAIIIFLPKLKNIFKYSFFLYLFNVILLVLVLFFGKEINGSRAWFTFSFISFQPSEFMKFTYSLYLTKLISEYKHKTIKKEILFLLKIFIIFLIPAILIFLEPDTGAIIFLIIITIICLCLSDIKKYFIVMVFITIVIFLSLFFYLYYFKQDFLIKIIGTSFFYRMDRIINFKNNMQLENALISISNSGIFGNGFKNISIYIPEAATDFVFSLCINSFGIITGLVLLLCYLILNIYFINLIYKSKNKTTRLFTSSFISIFIFSQIYNICMNIGLLPIMGIVLPLLSYGGSSMIVFALYISIILRINNI